MEFILTGKAGERQRFVDFLESFCNANSIPPAAQQAADLALEEHLTNVLTYGFAPSEPVWIQVKLHLEGEHLHVEVADSGKPYDPLSTPPVDTSIPLEEKPIGGLGVHLMRQFMDSLSYERQQDRNVLRMTKRLAS